MRERLKQAALDAGFDLAGIAPPDAAGNLTFARRWVEEGYGGEMRYLANPKRGDLREIMPSVASVVCVALVYNAPLPYSTQVPKSSNAAGWISRYAWGRDYHKVMRARLEKLRAAMEAMAPGVETRVYVDTGPIVERAFARLSGIGWTGKNTCLINQRTGSWLFLGIVLSNLAIGPDLPAPDRCGSCTRCIDACPTGALTPYVMDASRCISYLTIELRDAIPEELRPAIGHHLFGCDICQDVCPWNSSSGQPGRRGAATTRQSEFQPMQIETRRGGAGDGGERLTLFNPPLLKLAEINEEEFRKSFAQSPVKRAKYRGFVRNLCVTMGNSADADCIPWLEETAAGDDELVREHALWAIARLRGSNESDYDSAPISASVNSSVPALPPTSRGRCRPFS